MAMSKASVVILGGPDVDARLELMRRLRDSFEMSAAGSSPTLRERFSAEGFNYHSYSLSRRINPLSDLLTLGQLASTFQKLKPSIVHAFDAERAEATHYSQKPCNSCSLAQHLPLLTIQSA